MHFKTILIGHDIDDVLGPYNSQAYLDDPYADQMTFTHVAYTPDGLEFQAESENGLIRVLQSKGYTEKQISDSELHVYNNNGWWDYYLVGGRWSNILLDKKGNFCDGGRKGDLDIEATIAHYKQQFSEIFDVGNTLCKELGDKIIYLNPYWETLIKESEFYNKLRWYKPIDFHSLNKDTFLLNNVNQKISSCRYVTEKGFIEYDDAMGYRVILNNMLQASDDQLVYIMDLHN